MMIIDKHDLADVILALSSAASRYNDPTFASGYQAALRDVLISLGASEAVIRQVQTRIKLLDTKIDVVSKTQWEVRN